MDTTLVLSGLPGVGKTATARWCWNEARPDFEGSMHLEAGLHLDMTRFLDECYRVLPVERPPGAGVEELEASLKNHLRGTPVLFFLDNADGTPSETVQFLASLPSPVKLLMTVRSSVQLRADHPALLELSHPGLTDAEMEELLAVLVDRDPLLAEKFQLARREDVETVISLLQGWPQALLLVAAQLSSSTKHFSDFVSSLGGDIYEELLGDVYYRTLSSRHRASLLASSHFHATFSVAGLAAVRCVAVKRIRNDVAQLQRLRLISEQAPGQFVYAHPLIAEFIRTRSSARQRSEFADRAASFLREWVEANGGQPNVGWANFRLIDIEFDNLRILADNSIKRSDFRTATTLYRHLFSYIVERGYWVYAEIHCDYVLSQSPPPTYRAFWLVWASWIKFYLRADYGKAAELAEQAVGLPPRSRQQRFEAHRRALIAHGRSGRHDLSADHFRAASDVLASMGSPDLARADLLNSWGDSLLQEGRRLSDSATLEAAAGAFDGALATMRGAVEPNEREMAVAMLGLADVSLHLELHRESLALCVEARVIAERIGWLRGTGEAARITAEILEVLGQTEDAAVARQEAAFVSSRLRTLDVESSPDVGHL